MSGSGQLIERALDNLLGNAIKYSPQGASVELAVQAGENFIQRLVFILESAQGYLRQVPRGKVGRTHQNKRVA